MLGLLAILIAIATISDIVGQNICQVSVHCDCSRIKKYIHKLHNLNPEHPDAAKSRKHPHMNYIFISWLYLQVLKQLSIQI